MKTFLLSAMALWMAAVAASAAPVPVSFSASTSASAAGHSFTPGFGGNGRFIVFVSHANNLVTNDDRGLFLDVFVRDYAASETVLVSVNTGGVGGADADALYPSISSNGQFVAFASRASNLVDGDTNDSIDVFVRDLASGVTHLISRDADGKLAVDSDPASNVPLSGNPIISRDGRRVFFESRATNFGAPDLNNATDVFAHDLTSGETLLVSSARDRVQAADGASTLTCVSDEGRHVIFISTATNIAAGGTNAANNLYSYDFSSGESVCISTKVGSFVSGSYQCREAAVSADGRYVAFITTGTSNALFRHDVESNTTVLISTFVSTPPAGVSISADGRRIVFESTGGARLWDAGTERISVITAGGFARRPQLSSDGRFVVFRDVTPGLANRWSLFLRDLDRATNTLISTATSSTASTADFRFSHVALSPDASWIAFDGAASDLVENDANGANDVFVYDTRARFVDLISKAATGRTSATGRQMAAISSKGISEDGRFIAFARYDEPSLFRDTNGTVDIFVADLVTGQIRAESIDTNLYMPSGGGTPTYLSSTNRFAAPIISAQGSNIAASRLVDSGSLLFPGFRLAFFDSGRSVGTVLDNSFSAIPFALSTDGRLLLFQSSANNVPMDFTFSFQDRNAGPDVFIRRFHPVGTNLMATNYLLSGPTMLSTGNAPSMSPALSPDARWVVFATRAGDLVNVYPYDQPYMAFQIMAADLGTNRSSPNYLVNPPKRLVSYDAARQPLLIDCTNAVISGNSRYVFFDTTNGSAIYRHDLLAANLNLVVCTNCRKPSVSADGNIVAFEVPRTNSTIANMFVKNLQSGTTELINVSVSGAGGANGVSTPPLLSGDGRYVVFASKASDLEANDTNGFSDIFVRDRLLGATTLISANAQGGSGNGPSSAPVLGPDGRTVAFQSFANDLVPGDYNDTRDIFVLKLGGADTDGDGLDDDWEVAYFGNLSRNGSGDFDGDGQTDLQEFRAGTDPTNSDSIFRVLTVTPLGGGVTRILWNASPGRAYRVEFKNAVTDANWTALDGAILWHGSTASLTDASASGATRYYRVVRLP